MAWLGRLDQDAKSSIAPDSSSYQSAWVWYHARSLRPAPIQHCEAEYPSAVLEPVFRDTDDRVANRTIGAASQHSYFQYLLSAVPQPLTKWADCFPNVADQSMLTLPRRSAGRGLQPFGGAILTLDRAPLFVGCHCNLISQPPILNKFVKWIANLSARAVPGLNAWSVFGFLSPITRRPRALDLPCIS